MGWLAFIGIVWIIIDIIKEKQEYEEKRVDEIIKNC